MQLNCAWPPSSPPAGRFRATVRAPEPAFGRRVGSVAAARALLLRMTKTLSTRPARSPSRAGLFRAARAGARDQAALAPGQA
jgi:hypothetical protein